jgi:hypothetical protein
MEELIKEIKNGNSIYVFYLKKENKSIAGKELLKLSNKEVEKVEIENFDEIEEINFELMEEHNNVKFRTEDFSIRKLTFYDVNQRKNIIRYIIKTGSFYGSKKFNMEAVFLEKNYEETNNKLFGTIISDEGALKILKKNYPKNFLKLNNNLKREKIANETNEVFQKISDNSKKFEIKYNKETVIFNQIATFEKNDKLLVRTISSYYGINFMALTEKCRGKEKALALFFSETLSEFKVPVFHNKIKIEAKIGSSTFGFQGNFSKESFFFENYGTGESFSIKHNEVKNVKISFFSTILEDFAKFIEKLIPFVSETDKERLKKYYEILSISAKRK